MPFQTLKVIKISPWHYCQILSAFLTAAINLAIIVGMSRPSIKFVYSGEIRSPVNQLQKGPTRLQNFHESFMRPEYMKAPQRGNIQSNFYYPPPISNMEIQSKPATPSSMVRYRSVDNINIGRNDQQFRPSSPVLNIEETSESQTKIINPNKTQLKKSNKNGETEQLVLKAPSYKFTPKKEGEIAVHSKKQYKRMSSVERPLNGEQTLKSKKASKNYNTEKELQLRSSNPVNKVQTIKESDFLKQSQKQLLPKSPKNKKLQENMNFDQIVLKAPKYKYTPRQQGDIVVNRKKEYVKAEYTEKYLYQGVPKYQENDFIGCFGCGKPKPKVYIAEDE